MANKVNQSAPIASPTFISSIPTIADYLRNLYNSIIIVFQDYASTINALVDDNENPWIAYTPIVVAASGTITTYTATGRYKKKGKTVHVQADVTLTNAGTGAGNLKISLPFSATAFFFIGVSREIGVTDILGSAAIPSSDPSNAYAISATNTTFIATGKRVAMGVTYEAV